MNDDQMMVHVRLDEQLSKELDDTIFVENRYNLKKGKKETKQSFITESIKKHIVFTKKEIEKKVGKKIFDNDKIVI